MRTSILAAFTLIAPALAGVSAVSPAGAAPPAPGAFVERWCSDGFATPCLQSASRDTGSGPVVLTSSDPDWEVLQTGELTSSGNHYIQWLVQPTSTSGPTLTTTETWALTFDMGTVDPRYTEGYSGLPETQRVDDGDGTFHITYTAHPVLTAFACVPDGSWPTTCPTVAADDDTTADPDDDKVSVRLYGEVQDKAGDDDFDGFDVAQNADEVNGPFLETAPDGSQYLESFMANSHQYDSDPGPGVTPVDFKGQVRWRLPYRMLQNWFGIPNPATMVPDSLVGVVRHPDGSTGTASFAFTHDPAGKAWTVDVTDIGFSKNVLRVRTGTIIPTRPTQVSATRTSAHRGFVDFQPSKARGAKVTGYVGQCVPLHGDAVVTAKSDNIVRFTGLRKGAPYNCMVRATSKAGPSTWSRTVRMAGSPHS